MAQLVHPACLHARRPQHHRRRLPALRRLFDDKDVSPGTYVSGQWKEYGLRLSAEELDDGTGGFMPNGYPRLFDTAAPVNGEGYGTPGHTGDAGDVRVVQQTGGNTQ